MSVKQYSKWIELMTRLPKKARLEWVDCILSGLRSYRKGKAAAWLSDVIGEGGEFKLVGFAANVSYVTIDATENTDPKALYVHPWETPTLLLKHKRLPMVVMVSPSVRLDDTCLREIGNSVPNVEGFTG